MRRSRSGAGWRLVVVLGCCIGLLAPLGAVPAQADVFRSPSTGTHHVIGAILQRYQATGGPAGVHGYPVTDELPTPDRYGRYNHFQHGSIYWSPGTGAHSVLGAIRDRWAQMGWERSVLGYPLASETSTPDGRGRYSHFQGGLVYWTPATGAHAVYGAIRERWAQMGWETSVLRFPTTSELSTPDGRGRYNHFQHGSIYWSPATGAHAVFGAIRDRWAQMGWETSALGFPTSGEYAVSGGRAQDFQFGSIGWTPSGGTYLRGATQVGGGPLPLGVSPPGTQAITVTAAPGSTWGVLTAWERTANGWRAVLGPTAARVGSAGIGVAREGLARTPAGTFALTEAFGRLPDPGSALPYRRVDGHDWWVGDVRSPRYNEHVRCAPGSCPFDERASENLWAMGVVYDNAVVIDYNRPAAVPGAGSAFFLHVANQFATGGCVALDPGNLQALLRWLRPEARPVMSIGIG
ncbi:L,D-transpeptidase family protein [Trujillonella humicola]|uniref:L,D-transpeptidase family protein n=1 Tax=Trujillonella humicola TaxID=3383699 RepID=UPI00390648C9